ncbi:MAG: glycosyl transferase [Acidocella sp. 20-57-95]|nr:MAG: glycosyl transferase [Acidocella sp. 20-57-95]OYV61920.1 MAG: glycosyl transferase [Acidocella sp. 21-58-7]HQT63666.1 glycosyltransferase [Acidocella sp.]HQU04177.1 glycosyltransferase [Acidocella sp.]
MNRMVSQSTASLEASLHANAPRWTKPATPLASILIHGGVSALWVLLLARAFLGHGIGAWSVGIIYIAYDTALLSFTFWQTLKLGRKPPAFVPATARPSLTVIVAAYNEDAVLAATITALGQQSEPPEQIIIADDGSTDGTAALLTSLYGLSEPAMGSISAASAMVPGLRWLRAAHGGKARTLNQALLHVETDMFVTVDADTELDTNAIKAMRDAFQATPGLVAATGVLAPFCENSLSGQFFEWFQTYEYIRNFLGRYAWAQMDSLLLISGAFAAFRRDAVVSVGGFDPDCLVEDYELIHRLRRYGYDHGLNWHSTVVVGTARARTSAPSSILGFLRQRRRWFGGFLQTQLWYRDMVGTARYQRLGLAMLPVKAIDTFQPIYGLCAFGFLLWYLFTGQIALLLPIGGFIFGKIIIDLGFHLWSIHLYRNWVGGYTKANLGLAILASIAEPFSFQLLRHLGASWGWVYFLTGQRSWGVQKRVTVKPA